MDPLKSYISLTRVLAGLRKLSTWVAWCRCGWFQISELFEKSKAISWVMCSPLVLMGGLISNGPIWSLPVGGLPFLPSQWRWRCSPPFWEEFTNILGHHRRRVAEVAEREKLSGVFMRVTPTQRMPVMGWLMSVGGPNTGRRGWLCALGSSNFLSVLSAWCDPFPLFSPHLKEREFFLFPRTEKNTLWEKGLVPKPWLKYIFFFPWNSYA